MDLPQTIDEYIQESIDYSLGLQVSTHTLELKLRSSEEAERRFRHQYLLMKSKLKEKDETLQRVRAESSMNAQALKKFVDENQKLGNECANLLSQCTKWERECSLYDHDREALMDFGNEADERAKAAELRAHYLEEELSKLSEEMQFCKQQFEAQQVDKLTNDASMEHFLLDKLLSTLINKDEVSSTAQAFLVSYNGIDPCQKMLKMRDSLKPSTMKILTLASEAKILQKDKDHLRNNLTTAEDEVKVLFEENNMLEKENRRLMKLLLKERHLHDTEEKRSGGSIKNNKRKSSAKESSPVKKKIELGESCSPRQVLSPMQCNTPESSLHNK